jgi:lysozyme family protein
MTYRGTFEGQDWSSINPRLYRVEYAEYYGNRKVHFCTTASGFSCDHVYARYSDRSNICFPITVTHVYDLEEVK